MPLYLMSHQISAISWYSSTVGFGLLHLEKFSVLIIHIYFGRAFNFSFTVLLFGGI